MIEVENTDVNIVRNFIPMRNHMPASAYGLKAISDWLITGWVIFTIILFGHVSEGLHAKMRRHVDMRRHAPTH